MNIDNTDNTDKLAVSATMITPDNIKHDLIYCITHSNDKIVKRTARLQTVLELMGEDPNTYITALDVQEEQNTVVTDQEIVDFFTQPVQEITYDPVIFNKNKILNDSVKKAIEAELTVGMNLDGHLYKTTSRNLTRVLWGRIHARYTALCNDRKIIMVHKGGIAARRALLHAYPDKHDVIDKSFGLGGDNDVCLMIDPTLENFDELHKELSQFVLDFLNFEVWGFGEGHIATIAKNLKHIRVGGIYMKVSPARRQSFTIHQLPDDNKIMVSSAARLPVFTSYNEINITHEDGRTSSFNLIRVSQALMVTPLNSEVEDIEIPINCHGRLLKSEVLDIALPTQKDNKHMSDFEHYRSGLWANFNAKI